MNLRIRGIFRNNIKINVENNLKDRLVGPTFYKKS